MKIVVVSGGFDPIHSGHLSYFKEAKELGMYLIVGVNSDSSVKQIKGESRPIEDQFTREKKILSLGFVDAVCIFEQLTPLSLIKQICPDVLVKGADYKVDEIVGANFILSNGGKVYTIPLTPGFSTTNSIAKMIK